MSRNGSGTYNLPAGNPVTTGTIISSSWANNTLSDIATALTGSIAKDGQTTPTANLPMGNFHHTNVGDATALTQYLTASQAVNNVSQYLSSVSGTDTITASSTFTPAAYSPGQVFSFIAAGPNTTAVTLNISGLGAKNLYKRTSGGLVALVAKDLISGQPYSVIYDGTQFVLEEKRPYSQGADIASASTINLDTATGDYAHVTGTTNIDTITLAQGEQRTIVFDGILTLTYGASLLLPTGATITTAANDVAVFRGEASGVVRCTQYTRADGTALSSSASPVAAVRQTVLNGPVDTNGFSAFGGSTGSTTVTASGTLIPTAANGYSSSGNIDRIGSITNPSWTGLSTNGTMYLYLDIAANGTCTTGSTTLAPNYQWGGTYSTTSNQFTFNIQEMTGKVGNGSAATQTYRVFVGEVTVAGAVVTAITWYALNGRYRSATTATLPATGTTTSFNHNLGISPDAVLGFPAAFARCTTTDSGWAVGEVMPLQAGVGAPLSPYRPEANTGRNTAIMVAGVTNAWVLLVRSTGNNAAATLASWSYYMTLNRGW